MWRYVIVTYNYSVGISSGKIVLTSGANSDTVYFTYTKPSLSIYEECRG